MKSYLNNSSLPRGLRNNNPGNLIRSSITWLGKVEHTKSRDTRFEQFISLAHGTRAMILDLIGDIEKKKQNTVRKLVSAFAPPSENNTLAYINSVSKAVGAPPDQVLNTTKETLRKLIVAMVHVENGAQAASFFTNADFEDAYNLLPNSKKKLQPAVQEVS